MSYWKDTQVGLLPRGPGCYAIFENGKVVYVGSSTAIENRCRVYRTMPERRKPYGEPCITDGKWQTPWGLKTMCRFQVKVKMSRRQGDWLMWEYRLIRRLRPKYNRVHNK